MSDINKEKDKSSFKSGYFIYPRVLRVNVSANRKIMKAVFNYLLFMAFISLMVVVSFGETSKSYTRKSEINRKLITVMGRDGDLRALRSVYENRDISGFSIKQIFEGNDDFYLSSTPLSVMLEDIRTDIFLDSDGALPLSTVDGIIKEYEQVNPFDSLESAQKDYFENIRIKLGENYGLITGDVDKLASELKSKNALVSQYLKDSTISFWVSISALCISLMMGAYQIYQSRDSRFRSIIASSQVATEEEIEALTSMSNEKQSDGN